MSRLTRWLVPVVALALVGGAYGLGRARGRSLGPQLACTVEVFERPLAATVAGRVGQIMVTLGQRVHEGDLLFSLDSRVQEMTLAAAQAALAQAEAELEAQASIHAAQLARGELQQVRRRASVAEDRARLTEIATQLERLEKLAAQRLVDARELEAARQEQAGLKASLEVTAKPAGGATALGSSAAALALRLEPYRVALRRRQLDVEAARAAVAQTLVRAPAEGTVSALVALPGVVVAAGTEVVRLATGRPGYAQCWVPERYVADVGVGAKVELRTLGLGQSSFAGRVVELAPAVEELPPRARQSPTAPASWGRRIVVAADAPPPWTLGEALLARL